MNESRVPENWMVTACAAAAEQTNSTATAAELNTTRGMRMV